jgi:translation initiation factor eIF-2B subunit gamma
VKPFALHIRDSYRPAFSAKLEGCILGRNTKVGARAELLRSLTQAGYEADAGATIRNEKLEVSDWTAGPGEESDEE